MRLLVTRPEPDGERTRAALHARGHDVLLAPLLHIEPIADAPLGAGPWAAVLLTSANGARAILNHARRGELLALPVLAVGQGSAEAARAAGFRDVTSAGGDGGDLVRLAATRFASEARPLLHLTGEDRARDLATELEPRRIRVDTAVVYRARKAAALAPGVLAALTQGRIDGVLHFSARSAERYLECAGASLEAALRPTHFCLSERSAAPLRAAGASRVQVAARPDEAALLALVTGQPH